jgi:hypothetical protein
MGTKYGISLSFKNVELEMSYKSKEHISRQKDTVFQLEHFL